MFCSFLLFIIVHTLAGPILLSTAIYLDILNVFLMSLLCKKFAYLAKINITVPHFLTFVWHRRTSFVTNAEKTDISPTNVQKDTSLSSAHTTTTSRRKERHFAKIVLYYNLASNHIGRRIIKSIHVLFLRDDSSSMGDTRYFRFQNVTRTPKEHLCSLFLRKKQSLLNACGGLG